MSRVLFDIEGNGFLNKITEVHCIATEDLDTGEKNFFNPQQLEEGITYLAAAETLVGHNVIVYDMPALWKVHGDWPSPIPLVLDTLVLSYYLQPERKGGHSLAAWGERLGYPKGDFKEFEKYSEEMGIYCKQDVEVNKRVLYALEEEYGSTIPQGFKVFS